MIFGCSAVFWRADNHSEQSVMLDKLTSLESTHGARWPNEKSERWRRPAMHEPANGVRPPAIRSTDRLGFVASIIMPTSQHARRFLNAKADTRACANHKQYVHDQRNGIICVT
jgi:hypothetical protein